MRILDLYIFTTVPKPKFFQLRFPEGYKKGEILFRPEKGIENSGSPIPSFPLRSPQGFRDLFCYSGEGGSFSRPEKEMNFRLTTASANDGIPAFPQHLPAWA